MPESRDIAKNFSYFDDRQLSSDGNSGVNTATHRNLVSTIKTVVRMAVKTLRKFTWLDSLVAIFLPVGLNVLLFAISPIFPELRQPIVFWALGAFSAWWSAGCLARIAVRDKVDQASDELHVEGQSSSRGSEGQIGAPTNGDTTMPDELVRHSASQSKKHQMISDMLDAWQSYPENQETTAGREVSDRTTMIKEIRARESDRKGS